MLERHPEYKIINIEALTYAGNLDNLSNIADNPNYTFIKTDIRDRAKIDEIFSQYNITAYKNM